jgi:hypothetical protein
VVVRVTLNQPRAERHKVNGLLLFVLGQTFAGDCVVPAATLLFSTIAAWLQVIWVVFILADEVCEDCFFLTSGIKEQLDVFVELTPLLWLLGFVLVLFTEVVDYNRRLGLSLGLTTGS